MNSSSKLTQDHKNIIMRMESASTPVKINSIMPLVKKALGDADGQFVKTTWSIRTRSFIIFNSGRRLALGAGLFKNLVHRSEGTIAVSKLSIPGAMPSVQTFDALIKGANIKEVLMECFAILSGTTKKGSHHYVAISSHFSPTPAKTDWDDVGHESRIVGFTDPKTFTEITWPGLEKEMLPMPTRRSPWMPDFYTTKLVVEDNHLKITSPAAMKFSRKSRL